MTIKTRLILNSLITAAIIVAVSLISYSSIRFMQDSFFHLAHKSSPYQRRTADLQRAFERYAARLSDVNRALNRQEYLVAVKNSRESFESVKSAQSELLKIDSTNNPDIELTMESIANKLFDIVEARIKNEEESEKKAVIIKEYLKLSEESLKGLADGIKKLQLERNIKFTAAIEDTSRNTSVLRASEDLRNHLKDLSWALAIANKASKRTEFLIAKGRINMLMGRIAKNSQKSLIANEYLTFPEDIRDFLKLKFDSLAGENRTASKTSDAYFVELNESLNTMTLQMYQEVEQSAAYLSISTKHQGEIFDASNLANETLLLNSELLAKGFKISSQIHALFMVKSENELNALKKDIELNFFAIEKNGKKLESVLSSLNATAQLRLFKEAMSKIENVRKTVFDPDGLIMTLQSKINALASAEGVAKTVNNVVSEQVAIGNKNVLAAEVAQKTSITSVNDMITKALSSVSIISTVSMIFAMAFGLWIYRSILKPLQTMVNVVNSQKLQMDEKSLLAQGVASGNLEQKVVLGEPLLIDSLQISDDETGEVLTALVGMSQAQYKFDLAFSDMTVSLKNSRDADLRRASMNTALNELNSILREDNGVSEIAGKALSFIMGYLGAGVGILYRYEEQGEKIYPIAQYAVKELLDHKKGFGLGEGLPGQVARDRKKITFENLSPDYLPITSGCGASSIHISVYPVMHNELLSGVLEFGSFKSLSDDDETFLNSALEVVAIAILNNNSRDKIADLLEQTQAQGEELRVQQEELQQINEELLERAQMMELERG